MYLICFPHSTCLFFYSLFIPALPFYIIEVNYRTYLGAIYSGLKFLDECFKDF